MWDQKDAFHSKGEDPNWWWGRARMEIVHECMKRVVSRDMNILEIGAGFGRMTSMLSSFGSVKAIEPYPDAASYLQNDLGIETYHVVRWSPLRAQSRFDVVTCFDALEHIADDEKALSKMEALVKDKGFLILTVPAYMFLWNRHDEVNHHYRRYGRKELTQETAAQSRHQKGVVLQHSPVPNGDTRQTSVGQEQEVLFTRSKQVSQCHTV